MKIRNLLFCFLILPMLFLSCSDSNDEPAVAKDEKFEIAEADRMIELGRPMTTIEIKAVTNMSLSEWSVDQGNVKWLTTSKKSLSSTEAAIVLRVGSNTDFESRTATLNVIGSNKTILATITVTQAGDKNLKVDQDVRVRPTGGKASAYQTSQNIDKSMDGDYDTHYHSPWGSPGLYPVTLEYYFSGNDVVDYLTYYTRNGNGNFGRLTLYVATDALRNYQKIGDYDFGKKGTPSQIEIPGSLKPTAIKFEVHSGYADYVSCAEMEFYASSKDKPVEQRLLTVFTDLTCSELKPGVTDEMIDGLDTYFAKVARALRDNTYEASEKEFRIRTYNPYSVNTEWASRLMTKPYTDLDNPTGIAVNAGDEVVVCVGDTYGQTIALQSIWEETTGGYQQTQASGVTYLLRPGINKFTMKEQGQLFIMYNTDITSAMAKPIKIHIPVGSGTVTGFFDLKEHKTDEKYAELLAKASHKYFCVRGDRIMFYFHREKMPKAILSAINLWDDIISWQQELMGIDDVRPAQFNNHIFAISPEGSYMWATDYRVAFVYTYLDNILLRDNVMAAEDNAWGPAHEIGHIHQEAINWSSSSESSNNLFSNYIIYKLGKYKSRGRGLESVATARYVNGQGWFNMGDATHMNEDTETHMRMNWQLWNYYHRCGFKPDFWPTLFRLMRGVGLDESSDPGRKQLEFAKMASKAAGEDLTDFFEMWGFFVPVDTEIEQYGTVKYVVTEKMIAEAKAFMSQYPKPKHALQYIEDRIASEFPSTDYRYSQVGDLGYYTTFTQNKKVSAGASASVSGRRVSVSGAQNAVAIEIRQNGSDGKVVYFSNFLNFDIPASIAVTGCGLYAVQADGQRILLKNL